MMNKLACLFAFCLLLSCKEDDPIDVRKQAVGSYDYNGTGYYQNKSGLLLLPKPDFTGTLDVALDPADDTGLLITESSDGVTSTYKGHKLAATDNGFSFDIASRPISSGSTVIISGYQGYETTTGGGSKIPYHGGFVSDTNVFGFWWQYRDVNTGIVFVFHMEGTKKQ
jgi:hypothetical protein